MKKKQQYFCGLLTLLGCLLSGCTSQSGSLSKKDFVSLASLQNLSIQSLSLKTKAVIPNDFEQKSQFDFSAHGCAFYSENDFSYSLPELTVLGHHDEDSSLYFLINTSLNAGFYSKSETLLQYSRQKSESLLANDYSFLVALYQRIQQFVTWSSNEINQNGFTQISIKKAINGETVGYSAVTVEENEEVTRETIYYMTLKNNSFGYSFSNVIIREKLTQTKSQKECQFDKEWNIVSNSELPDAPFVIALYTLFPAGSVDCSTLTDTEMFPPIV